MGIVVIILWVILIGLALLGLFFLVIVWLFCRMSKEAIDFLSPSSFSVTKTSNEDSKIEEAIEKDIEKKKKSRSKKKRK